MKSRKIFWDKAKHCNRTFVQLRRISNAGKIVKTTCPFCYASFDTKVGYPKGLKP